MRHSAAGMSTDIYKPCTEDFTFHVPGTAGISGVYVGKTGCPQLAGKAMEITGRRFHEEVEMCWQTIVTRWRWRGHRLITVTEPRRTIGRRTCTKSARVN